MKKLYATIFIVISTACLAQEQKEEPKQEEKQPQFSTNLSVAVRQNNGWGSASIPDFSYYNRNFSSVFNGYGYTFNIDEAVNNSAIYVDSNKYYNGSYIPVVAQMHNTNLGADNIFYYNQNASTFSKPVGVDLSALKGR